MGKAGNKMIVLHQLSKSYQTHVLKNFSYTFPETGIVCLFGPSGCGKTTLLRLLLGLEKPNHGTIQGLEGKRTSIVFQEDQLLPWLTGWENILSTAREESLCHELVKAFEMEESVHKFPAQMSGGMKRRIAILRALAYDGDVFFLDEPFQALDLVKRKNIIDILHHRLEGKLVIFVTHHIEEVLAIADRLLILQGSPLVIAKEMHRKDFLSEKEMASLIAPYYEEA